MSGAETTDAELVGASLTGNRDAFGRIVTRYQSLICSLAYSATGCLGQSEDLAQETFITAWRHLRHLREPGKLRAWLCGIARNRINSSLRREGREPLRGAEPLDAVHDAPAPEPLPPDCVISKEEEAILWRSLERIPETYREPLVLFYREHQSIERVAGELELSEDAVKQRLSRGRKLLHEQVLAFVEGALARTNPGKAFTFGVLAALPVFATSASAATVASATATAKGTGALKTAGGFGSAMAVLSGVLPALGGLIGLWGHIQNTRTRRERRFIAWTCLGLVGWMILLGLVAGLASGGGSVFGLRVNRSGIELSNAIYLSLLWLAFCGPLDAYAIWIALRQKRIRAEECGSVQRPPEATRRGYRLSMYGSMLAMVFGTTSWLFIAAHQSQDWTTLGALTVLCVAGWLGCAGLAVKRPKAETVAQVFIWLWWGLAFVSLAVFNLRWSAWQSVVAPRAPSDFRAFLNVLICVFFGSVRAMWYLKWRLLKVSTVKRDSLIALAVYFAVMVAGAALYQGVKVGDVPEVQATQVMHNEIQPDGTIRFQSLCDFRNFSRAPMREVRCGNSDSVHVERMNSATGQPMPFQVEHNDSTKTFTYVVSLKEPVPPGKCVFLTTEGYITGKIHRLGDREFKYSEQHWPATGVATLRVETYRLPAGAQVLETTPADMEHRQLPDGRLELRTRKIIPPNDAITVRIKFRASP